MNASIIAQTRLKDPEEFGKVTLRVNSDGSVVHLKDVARIELGGENYNVVARINGKPASGLGIKLATGANALDTANAIKAKLVELQPFFPQGMKVVYPYDTTPFVTISIHEVVKTLFEAIVLVFPGHVFVPAKHPGNAHSNHRCPCRIVGHIRRTCRVWLLDKHPDDVRHGARHRSIGR